MSRKAELELLLRQLDEVAAGVRPELLYAWAENRALLEAMGSVEGFMRWVGTRMEELDGPRVREINEIVGGWDERIHRELLLIQKKRWPAFVLPLVRRVERRVREAGDGAVVVDIGSGAMEVERQLLAGMQRGRDPRVVTFVGVDVSGGAMAEAKQNLEELGEGVEVAEAGAGELAERVREPVKGRGSRSRVILCQAPAERALEGFGGGEVDVLFHSLFRHHLTEPEGARLAAAGARVARRVIEYDGYYSKRRLLAVAMLSWRSPAFLAAFVMSHARFARREELANRDGEMRVLSNGCYLWERAGVR